MPPVASKKKKPPELPAGKSAATPPPVPVDEESSRKAIIQTVGVCATSFVLHAIVFLIMGFVILGVPDHVPLLGILSSLPEPEKEKIEFEDVVIEKPEEVLEKEKAAEIVVKVKKKSNDRFEVDINDLQPSATLTVDPNASAPTAVAPPKGQFGGRSKAGRSALVAKYGGNKNSEAAVRRGLEWLKRHQNYDGSWSFDHRVRGCNCQNPGRFARTTTGATAMALLCFLGAGHTFSEGDFQPHVEKGLLFLLKSKKATPQGFDFRGNAEGNSDMYVQALVTIALSEAMAMNDAAFRRQFAESKKKKSKRSRSRKKTTTGTVSNRRRIRVSNQLATACKLGIYFIVSAQSTKGGWRYRPGMDSDTSVVGWQVMALASAHSAGIRVPTKTVRGVNRYLNSVQTRDRSRYGYTSPRPTPAMTAVGLLCRLYLGWRRGNRGIQYGVRYLSNVGPSKTNMYYNYYATQVMHQYGGDLWKKWNKVMRDQLVATQLKIGHASGSWDVTDPHGGTGGRLYQTCLSIMTLEVYYRHLPLYAERDLESDTEADGFSKKSTRKRSRKRKRKPGKTKTTRKKPVAKK